MDATLLAPHYVTSNDFMREFALSLRHHLMISSVILVEDTHAPVIKFLMTLFWLQIRTLALLWIRRNGGEYG